MSTPGITIIGAGLAGLTLGRCLRARGIAPCILERFSSKPRFNYGITLYPWAYKPLLKLLQMDEAKFVQEVSIDAFGDIIGSAHEEDASSSNPDAVRCHRGSLELLLREGLNIKWNHAVTNIKGSQPDILIQTKKNGSLQSTMLIACDGVHSQIHELLPRSNELKVLPYAVFNGRRTLPIEEYERLFKPYMDRLGSMAIRVGTVRLRITLNAYNISSVDLGYEYSRPAHENDPISNLDRPISGASQIPAEFYSELEQLKDLEPPFTGIFDSEEVRKDKIVHWLMRSRVVPLELCHNLASRGILLIGDTAHTMPILGGEGANLAIQDAFDLAECIAQDPQDLRGFYEETRYSDWTHTVAESERRLNDMHSGAKEQYEEAGAQNQDIEAKAKSISSASVLEDALNKLRGQP